MRQIRQSVFETNSSSTHSLSIVTKQEYDDWTAGKTRFSDWDDKFYDKSDKEGIKNDAYTYRKWFKENNDGFETFSRSFTTPKGEEMVAFGYYGYNG